LDRLVQQYAAAVLSLPIPLRLLLAARPELSTPVLGVVQQVLSRQLIEKPTPDRARRLNY
jgi:hypothetical protein